MLRAVLRRRQLLLACTCLIVCATAQAQERREASKNVDKTSASRLRAVREIMQQITIESTAGDRPQTLEFNPHPLLRYNDAVRGIADSCIFRVGTEGRPMALVSAELYGRQGRQFLLNHEFIALYQPAIRMKRDVFTWEPPEGNLEFQDLPDADPPSPNARLRLAQMRRLAERFSASETLGGSRIELRRLATPLDRYTPSDQPNADGAMFAFAWGVNPEALLFIETNGRTWVFGWAPLGAAALEAKLGDDIVWELPLASEHESPRAPYTSIYRTLIVPDYFDDEVRDAAGDGK